MRDFEHAYNVLKKVVNENTSFNLAVTSELKTEKRKIDNSYKASINSVCGCVLRHYCVFKEIVNREYENLEEDKFLLISLGLANNLFAHKFNDDELIKFIEKESALENVKDFILSHSDNTKLIPEDIEFGSRKYFSLRYNIPMWIVNMWEKNCGYVLSKKLYRSLNKKDFSSMVRINNNNIDDEAFFNKYTDLLPFEEKGVAFVKEGNLKHHPCLEDDALLYPLGYKFMCDSIDIDAFRGIAFYSGCPNHLLKELYLRIGKELKMDYLVSDHKDYFEAHKFVKKFGLNNLAIFETKCDAMTSCISAPVHTMFVCPRNTNLNNLIEKPDYFLRIKQEDLDSLINEQKEALENASKHVEDNGYLIYFLPTVCRNETRTVVRKFLKEHPEFIFVNEKQLFPFDLYKSMLYFAILKKEVKDD